LSEGRTNTSVAVVGRASVLGLFALQAHAQPPDTEKLMTWQMAQVTHYDVVAEYSSPNTAVL
jgi:hypothetical protein